MNIHRIIKKYKAYIVQNCNVVYTEIENIVYSDSRSLKSVLVFFLAVSCAFGFEIS
jgi:phage regulator Rha-like protein